MKEDHGLCPGSTMLGQEGQSTYARSTTPFGGVHPGITQDDGMVCFISWMIVILGSVALPEGFF